MTEEIIFQGLCCWN